MREIKFRGKTTDGRWIEGVPIKNGFGKLVFMCAAVTDNLSCPMEKIHKFCIEVIPETVTQYLGLRDKNGTEIYDGDYIRYSRRTINGSVFTHVCRVFQHESGTWRIEGYHEDNPSYETKGTVYEVHKVCEVIGNIYENPELVK